MRMQVDGMRWWYMNLIRAALLPVAKQHLSPRARPLSPTSVTCAAFWVSTGAAGADYDA